jgi:hypothetical protein
MRTTLGKFPGIRYSRLPVKRSSLFSSLFSSEGDRDRAETIDLYNQVLLAHNASLFARENAVTDIGSQVLDAIREIVPIPEALRDRLIDALVGVLCEEDRVFDLPGIEWQSEDLSVEERMELRNWLRDKQRFVTHAERTTQQMVHILANVFAGILLDLPDIPFGDGAFAVPLIDLVPDPHDTLDRTIGTFETQFALDSGLFAGLHTRFWHNACHASDVDPYDDQAQRRVITVAKSKLAGAELVAAYLDGTPFADFFRTSVPFHIPLETRFEHTHILAAQGHGKTQTLQHLIAQDLLSPDPPSMVIIDSQGQMIEKIQRLDLFRPDHGQLSHRLIIIHPKDEVPPALNVFDINQERLAHYGPQMREQVLNGVLELYGYLFGSLRADLTQQQSTIFRAFARLMLTVPNANLGTLYELLVDHKPFLSYIEKLSEPSRSFFLNDFILPAFNPTRQQIRRRLFDLLDNYTLKRMLSAPQNRLNMFEALNTGKIVVVNTSKEFFKTEQSAFFGRFFIALALQAIEERAGIPESQWHPVLIYIDEAQEYFDDQIAKIITELRKYNCGLVFCHHDLAQLPQGIRSAAARCAIQMVGGAIDSDARALASDLRTSSQFILEQKRDPKRPPQFTEYACYVRNQTEHAVSVRVPFYTLENEPTMDDLAHQILRQVNRNIVGILPEGSPPIDDSPPTTQPQQAAPTPGEPPLNLHDPDLPSRLDEDRSFHATLRNRLTAARDRAQLARHNHDWQTLKQLEEKTIPELERRIATLQKQTDDLASEEY